MHFIVATTCLLLFAATSRAESNFGITGGTKGIGFKYAGYGKFIGMDLGIPLFYKYDKRTGDSIEYNHDIRLNSYVAISTKVFNKNNNVFAVGLSALPTFGFGYKTAYDTVKSKRNLFFDNSYSPFLQYTKYNENGKFMSFELFPFSFYLSKDFIASLSPNVQVSIYIRKQG